MPLISARVDVNMHFDRVAQEVHAHAKRAVQAAAIEGAQAANAVGSARNFSVDVESVRPTVDGWQASFVCRKGHAWFHEYGTLGSRTKRLKQAPRTNRTRAPGTGIDPLGFLAAGRDAGLRALKRELSRGL